ncbi:ARF/SAR superfamily [Eremomyces bilateralis CBS 781.70]|uniref:Abnormal eversion of vulva protein 20 n=1 Tax=Eremomyces bilateralis CBS 781.70 TaxID=1392243 RepID=A0A6G1GD78_9PEZI|nr:ARF/SAR superfamily [Eremomyces bilateralis CBS 781.70]KAF1815983.1 ARF/SAR superfamily [Eremomyces bilateralis CBS 781.70]
MLSILRKARLKDKELRVLILGLDNAGKTTIVNHLLGKDTSQISPTLGFVISTVDWDGYRINIWDVGGQKTLRTYWRNYFERTDTLLWVVDATDEARMNDCREELANLLVEERLMGASLLVVKNKTDVHGCLSNDQVRDILRLDDIRTHRWSIMECSAMTGQNLPEAMNWVLADAKERLFLF